MATNDPVITPPERQEALLAWEAMYRAAVKRKAGDITEGQVVIVHCPDEQNAAYDSWLPMVVIKQNVKNVRVASFANIELREVYAAYLKKNEMVALLTTKD